MDFGKHANGTYQTALSEGHNLGVFASSDHRSTPAMVVFCKKFTREGIIEAMDNRRTIAATDKICRISPAAKTGFNIQTKADRILVKGGWNKSDFKRITIVRNEKDWKHFNDLMERSLRNPSLTRNARWQPLLRSSHSKRRQHGMVLARLGHPAMTFRSLWDGKGLPYFH